MKNIKRILSLVIVVSMLFSFATVTNAATTRFEDVSVNHKYAEAIELLTGLGIITGYGNGVFKPENTVTRGEAATIIVRTLGLGDDAVQGDTIFSDVKASHWASGYINLAVNAGIINGFPDGTFRPDDTLTYEQIVKMVVCAIGHELKALNYASYPDGYLRAASDAGVTKGITGSRGSAASRGLVAQLIYNALEVEMMDATSFSTGILGTSYSLNGETLLNDYLEIEKVDAVVTDTYLAGESYSAGNDYITLDITNVYSLDNRHSRALYEEGDVVSFMEGEGTNANLYLGYAVTAYVGEDFEGENTIFAITLDEGRNTEIEITQENIYSDSNDKTIYYAKTSSAKNATKLALDDDCVVIVNGVISDESVSYYYDDFDLITVVNNDRDSYYDAVFVTVFDESEGVEFMVTDIEKDDDYWCFIGDDGELELDYENEDVIIKIIRDGDIIDPDDISEGDVVTCLDTSNSAVTVYVSSDVVKGSVDEIDYDTGEYLIDDETYMLSAAFADELEVGDEGTFYLNYKGKIAYTTVSSTVTSGDYVFITDYGTTTSFSKVTYLIQAVTKEGKVKSYTLKASGMKYITADGVLSKKVKADEVVEYLQSETTDLSDQYGVDGYVGLARIKASSLGVISEIYLPGSYDEFYEQTKYAVENSKEYSVKYGRYGNYRLENDTVVFRVDDNEEFLTDAVAVGEVKTMFTDGSNYTFTAYGERKKDIEVLVVTDGLSKIDYSQHAILVTKTPQASVNGEPTVKIVGIQNGVTVTYYVDPDENFDIEPGNIILATLNGDGYVKEIEYVACTTDDIDDLYNAFDCADVPSDEDAGVFGGMVEEVDSDGFIIADIDEVFFDDPVTAFYLIDYTSRTTSYQKSSLNAIKVSKNYDTFAIVRTYENEAIDVFVFRVKADEVMVDSTNIWDNIGSAQPEEVATEPTEETTVAPTEETTVAPTEETTVAPTEETTVAPTEETTAAPTEETTVAPTEETTVAPTEETTVAPTEETTVAPTEETTVAPTEETTAAPTEETTVAPTEETTVPPTEETTVAPTEETTEDIVLAGIETETATEIATEKATVSEEMKMAQEVLTLVNKERAAQNLPSLKWDDNLYKMCSTYATDMAKYTYLNRTSRDGSTLVTRLVNSKIAYTLAYENLAKGAKSSASVVNAWMGNAGYKEVLLNKDVTNLAVGVAKATDGTYYWYLVTIK